MKKYRNHILASIVIISMLAGCQLTALKPPASAVISAQNASQLQIVRQEQIGAFSDLIWSLDGSHLLLVQGGQAARVDSSTLKVSKQISFEAMVMMVSAAPDGKTLVYSTDGSSLQIKDLTNTQPAEVIESGMNINNIDFSPDGRWLLATSNDAIEARLWDTTSREQLKTLSGFQTAAPVYNAWFGGDSAHILWVSRATVQPMSVESGQLGPELNHEDFVNDAELSPDSRLVATAAYGSVQDGYLPILSIWNAASGEILAVLPYEKDAFTALAFSPDSRLVAAANGAGVTIWDAANPQLLADLNSGTDFIGALAFSPDGSQLASISSNGTLAIWQVK